METVLWISADGPLSAIKDSVETKCTGGHDNLFLIMKCININPNFDQQIITPWMAVWILETSIFFRHIVHKKSECHVKKFWQNIVYGFLAYRWGAGDNSCLLTFRSTHRSGRMLISRIPRDPYSGKYCSSPDVLELCKTCVEIDQSKLLIKLSFLY